jgi:hypothetical protein
MTSKIQHSKGSTLATRGTWILALALVAGPGAWAQQDQPPPPPPPQDSHQQQQNQQDTQGQQQGDQQQQSAPQDQQQAPNPNRPAPRNRRVLSTDRLPNSQAPDGQSQDAQQQDGQQPDVPQQQGTPDGRRGDRPYRGGQGNGQGDGQRVEPARLAPDTLTLPKGTVLQIRTNDFLSSDHSKKGDHFTATLQQPLVVNGFVVARRGQTIEGEVAGAQKAGRVKGVSQLGLTLTDVALVDGQTIPIQTELWQGSGGTSHGADAATIATTTGLGAAIGAAANLGTGAAVGAGAGLLTGIGAVLLTRGRPTIIPPETELTFRLTDAVTINTAATNKQAYRLLQQDDFGNGRGGRRPGGPYVAGYRGGYPCGPYGPCYGPPVYYGPYPYFYYGRPWGWRRW